MRKEGTNMSNKSSSVIVRIEPDVKAKAEAIMSSLGLPVSVVINALYRQIIYTNSIPFSISIPNGFPIEEYMTDEEFNEMIDASIAEAKNGEGEPAEKVLKALISKHKKCMK